jgi:hypothetical protein
VNTTATQTTHANNAPNKTLHHHKLGEKAKEATASCAVVTNVVSRQKRLAASLSGTSNSSAMGNHPQANRTTVDLS